MGIYQETVGIKFPLVLTNGGIKVCTELESIESSLNNILLYPKDTREYDRAYGTTLMDLLDEPNDGVLQALVETTVRAAISSYEQRIQVLAVSSKREEATLLVAIYAIVKTTGRPLNFLLPLK